MKILFLTFIFSSLAFSQDLNFGSPRCQQLAVINPLETAECDPNLILIGNAINELNQSSDQLQNHLTEVGTIHNLNLIIKDKLLHTHFETFKQKLILYKGLGGNLSEFRDSLESQTCLPPQTKQSYLSALDEINETEVIVEEQKNQFLKTIKSVFVEINRFERLIDLYQDKPERENALKIAQEQLAMLYRNYPMLIQKDSSSIGNYAELFTARVLYNYARPEDLLFHAHKTSPEINNYIPLPQPLDSQLESPFDRRDPNFSVYNLIHHRIQNENYQDAMFDELIPNLAKESVTQSLTGLNSLCEASPCETFKLIPHDIPAITSEISDSNIRDRVDKYICDCEIRRQEETLPLSVHMGILAGTVGMGIGCIAFAPLCVGAAAIGIAGTVAGYSDFVTVQDNHRVIVEETTAQVAVRDYHRNYQEDLLRLEISQRERNLSAMFLPLEFIGAAGDFVAVGRSISRADNVIVPFKQVPFKASPLSRLGHINDRNTLLRQFKSYDPTSDEIRRAWIATARSNSAQGFLDIENGMLKKLNDLGDKDVVTALTNAHKNLIMDGIIRLQARYPDLEITKYSDFKSIRFAFDGVIPQNLQEELNSLFNSAGDQISELVTRLTSRGELQLPAGENPRYWFAGGYGDSADAAGLAAREARCTAGTPCSSPIQNFSNAQTQSQLQEGITRVEDLRGSITETLSSVETSVPLLMGSGSNRIPSPDLIEAVRKNIDKSPEELAQILKRRFGHDFSTDTANDLTGYINGLKRFEPGLWIESRQLASLDDAAHGGFSADFTGMGSFNIEQVARDLASHNGDMNNLLGSLRRGEQSVTEGFNEKKEFFEMVTRNAFERSNVDLRITCSGDDCVAFPTQNPGLSRNQQKMIQENLVREINNSSSPDGFRLAFVPPNATREARSQLATHGELLEKAIRKISFGEDAIPYLQSKNLTIATRMPSSLNQGRVDVVIGGAENLTPTQRQELSTYISQALRSSNNEATDMAKEFDANAVVNYTVGEIDFID